MKQTSDFKKKTFISNVINLLEKNEKRREILLINKQSDLTKMYKRAQSFVREYKQLFDGIDLYKPNDKLDKNEKGLYDNDIVGETDDKFISEIEKSDKSIIRNSNLTKRETNSISHLMKLVFFGETSYKIKKEFIDKLEIKKVLVGYKNGNEVYYSEEFNSLYEIV